MEHTRDVYNDAASEYAVNSHTQDVTDALIEFIGLLPDGSSVLDIGCGHGRDALFLATTNEDYRKGLMGRIDNRGRTTLQKYPVPSKHFQTLGIDASEKMIEGAKNATDKLVKEALLPPQFAPTFQGSDIFDFGILDENWQRFNGVWSCAAMFTHTPGPLEDAVLYAVSGMLKKDGVFALSYTNGSGGRQDKPLLSSTGRIKYFSQPSATRIMLQAKEHSLALVTQYFVDYIKDGKIIKPKLFVTQFFRKV